MMNIPSPYDNVLKDFDNEGSFSDCVLAVPGIRKPLFLHKRILANASKMLKKEFLSCSGKKYIWPFDTSNEIDKRVLIKALRFCYGETIKVETKDGECCAMIAVLSRLQVTCLEQVMDKLNRWIIKEAREDVIQGVELLKKCVGYHECCGANHIELNKELAKVVLTKQNMFEHFREVVVECLMVLPPEYLDGVEYGEPHTQCCEFCLRIMYARCHAKEMSHEEKQALVRKCDWSKLSSHELRELRLSDFVEKDELLAAYETVLACCENERDKERQNARRIESEKEKEKERADEGERKNEEYKTMIDYLTELVPLYSEMVQLYQGNAKQAEKRMEKVMDGDRLL